MDFTTTDIILFIILLALLGVAIAMYFYYDKKL